MKICKMLTLDYLNKGVGRVLYHKYNNDFICLFCIKLRCRWVGGLVLAYFDILLHFTATAENELIMQYSFHKLHF